MQRRAVWIAAAAIFAAGALAAAPARYEIDPNRSTIRFTVPYVFMILGEVEGEFTRFSGGADYDPDQLAATLVRVEIEAASLDTRFAPRDLSLRGDGFFAVDDHPAIRFESREIAAAAGGHELVGDITLRGVTRETRIPFELLEFGDELVVLGTTRLDRHEFGMAVVGETEDFRIGETVTVRLHLTLTRARAPAAAP